LGQEARIVGISGYTVRPKRAREEKPKVSAFLSAKIDKILDLRPDCVLGFSDLQADIAAELVRKGVQVHHLQPAQRGRDFSMLYQVAAMVGEAERGLQRIERHAGRPARHASRSGGAAWPPVPADPRCFLKSGTRRTSAPYAGCPS